MPVPYEPYVGYDIPTSPAQPSYLAPTYPQPIYTGSPVATTPSDLARRYATAPVPQTAAPWVDPATVGTPPTLYLGQRPQGIDTTTLLLIGGALLLIVVVSGKG